MRLLLSINASGTTVLMATHNQFLSSMPTDSGCWNLHMGRVVRDEKRGRYELDGDF
jgi:cell division transport system ATP-binding protein